MVSKQCRLLFLSLFLGVLAQPAIALQEDRSQPIRIQADSVERSERNGTTIYSGSVVMTQGSMRIEADRIEIQTINDEVSEIIATGVPAHFQQQPEEGEDLLHAKAETIHYYVSGEKIELLVGASLVQEGSTLQGNRIDYFLEEERVLAVGDTSTENNSGGRVEVILPPKQSESE